MKRQKKWYFIGGGFILSLLFLSPLLLYWIINSFVLTPPRLKALLLSEFSRQIKGEFDCRSVELTYWETWPYIGVALTEGSYVVADSLDADTTPAIKPGLRCSFHKLVISVHVLDYLRDRKIKVREITIDQPEVYAQNVDGQSLDLLKTTDVKHQDDNLRLALERLRLKGGNFCWENRDGEIFRWYGIHLDSHGEIVGKRGDLSLLLKADSSSVAMRDHVFRDPVPMSLKGKFQIDLAGRSIDVLQAEASVMHLPLAVNGRLAWEPALLRVDASWHLSTTEINELLCRMPSSYLSPLGSYEVKGQISLDGEVNGSVGQGILPDVRIHGKLRDGSVFKKGQSYGLDTIAMEFLLDSPSAHPDSSMLEIKDLNISGLDCYAQGYVKISRLMQKPFWDMHLRSNVNFDRLGNEFLDPDTILLSGELNSDLSLVFNQEDLRNGRYDRVWADGNLDIERLRVHSDAYELYVFASNIHGSIGYRQNKSDFIKQREVLGGSLRIDTLNIRQGKRLHMALSGLDMSSNTGLQQDTGAVTPVTTHIGIRKIQSRLEEDIAALASNLQIHVGLKPLDSNKRQVALAVALTSDTLEYLNIQEQQATILSNSRFISEFYPRDNGVWTYVRDPGSLLPRSDLKGVLAFDGLRSFSRRFPLQVHVRGTQLGFKNNQLILKNAEVQAGKSDAVVSGELQTFKRQGEDKRFLEGNLSVRSRYIDFEELKRAISQGDGWDKEDTRQDQTAMLLNIEDLDKSIGLMEESEGTLNGLTDRLVELPGNLRLDLSMQVQDMAFSGFSMEKMKGTVSLRDRKAICDFSTHTDMGDTHVSLLYKPLTYQKADVYLDWEMSRIQVGKLKKIFPAMGTLFPMLNSIDGILDCGLTAYCPIDSAANVDLGTLHAICSLDGKDMVLFSTETFHEIANKLRFKDKEKNKIDHIAVDFIAKNAMIDIFPFALDMDRYRFLVGGKHSMDMSFNYQIDVLKSPIPFNFGLRVDGKLGAFEYKLGKTKYKHLFDEPIRYEEFRMSKQRKMDEVRAGIVTEMRKEMDRPR